MILAAAASVAQRPPSSCVINTSADSISQGGFKRMFLTKSGKQEKLKDKRDKHPVFIWSAVHLRTGVSNIRHVGQNGPTREFNVAHMMNFESGKHTQTVQCQRCFAIVF